MCKLTHKATHKQAFNCDCGDLGQAQDPMNLIHLLPVLYPVLIKLYAADLLCCL